MALTQTGAQQSVSTPPSPTWPNSANSRLHPSIFLATRNVWMRYALLAPCSAVACHSLRLVRFRRRCRFPAVQAGGILLFWGRPARRARRWPRPW